jgi:hypothetical protein
MPAPRSPGTAGEVWSPEPRRPVTLFIMLFSADRAAPRSAGFPVARAVRRTRARRFEACRGRPGRRGSLCVGPGAAGKVGRESSDGGRTAPKLRAVSTSGAVHSPSGSSPKRKSRGSPNAAAIFCFCSGLNLCSPRSARLRWDRSTEVAKETSSSVRPVRSLVCLNRDSFACILRPG